MAAFIKLDDSPMFQKQINSIEQTSGELKDRCQRLYKGCQKFVAALGEACAGDTCFADSLVSFGGGVDDPVSVSIGGPVMSNFIAAFHELAGYKELLRSQESRQRLDKSEHAYDQAREKFVSLKKNTREDIVQEFEEDLQNSKSAFERSRFNLVNALMNIEAKKKYEFLESISAIMDAHLRYFKLGYELLKQMEPYIHQVLTYAQQSKEQVNIEQDNLAKRIQEFRTQSELDNLRASTNMESSANGHVTAMSSYKNIEAIMQSTADGEIQTIKQGYLLKRSSSLRTDWKRRFFVLDSQGSLYYYRNKGIKRTGFQSHHSSGTAEPSRMFDRFRARHAKTSSLTEESLACRTIDLRAASIKFDAEDTDLRLCFRIISPIKTYTLQTENAADMMDWVNKTKAVIAFLLNSHFLQQAPPGAKRLAKNNYCSRSAGDVRLLGSDGCVEDGMNFNGDLCVPKILREIPGNDRCAECNSLEPEWASLNLGILLCIECSGVHRNLGVHISKVRSLTLDVKVWDCTMLELFRSLGNAYCNSIWEGLLPLQKESSSESDAITSVTKPCPKDSNSQKEKYIQAKYMKKMLVNREPSASCIPLLPTSIWDAVKSNNLQEVYRIIVMAEVNMINTTFDSVVGADSYHHADAQESSFHSVKKEQYDPGACHRIKGSNDPSQCLQGCSLLHLACHYGNPVMIELLLQFGADMNMCDYHGRTSLHHCISIGNNELAKFLLRRGACPSIKDGGGLSALDRAMESGAITDEELFLLLSE